MPWLVTAVIAAGGVVGADEVPAPVIAMFDRYVEVTEARMQADRQDGRLLWLDRQPDARRTALYRRLAAGDVVAESLRTENGGTPPPASTAVFLHAIAAVHLRGASVAETLSLLQDVDRHAEYFAPTIRRSRAIGREGDAVIVAGQFAHRKVVTIVYNAEVETRCGAIGETQAECRAVSRRGAMVADAGRPTEREKGFRGDARKQWFMRSYYRVEARGDGTTVELETLFVCPPLPRLLRLFTPLARDAPAEVSEDLLAAMRTRLSKR